MSAEPADILEAIRALPREDRVRLVQQLKHDLADEGVGVLAADPRAIIGLFSDEAELIKEVCRGAMEARERDRRPWT